MDSNRLSATSILDFVVNINKKWMQWSLSQLALICELAALDRHSPVVWCAPTFM